MPANEPRKSGTRKTLFVLLLALVLVAVAYTYFQENKPWVIPEEAKARKNPLQPSEAALKSAKALYAENCANCHGDSGKGDGSEAMRYDPKPADFTDALHMNTATDGALFYQISQGKKPMPPAKSPCPNNTLHSRIRLAYGTLRLAGDRRFGALRIACMNSEIPSSEAELYCVRN